MSESWTELFRKSDLSPRPQVWLRVRQTLQKRVTHLEHPLETAGQNPDRIGAVYKRLSIELPALRTLLDLSYRMDQGQHLPHAEFIRIKRTVANQLIGVARKPNSDLQVFAALEALRLISTIESRVDFPKTAEEIREEKREKEKKEKEKAETEEEQEEQEPEWNKADDKYKPENNDLGEGKEKKKNVDIALTSAVVKKPLMRQKIYDEFDLKGWSSVPVMREPLQREAQFTKKLIINPLNATSVDVPIPYGYTLAPGKYPDHRIIETGAGEFKLQVSSKNPVTLKLARIQRETHLGTPPKTVNAKELNFWPQHLLLFAQSLKGLSPLEAASRLEKYIAEDGGFLYYSKGDKLDKNDLAQIDSKLAQLLTQMPKPMAMAHVGAFNCDGAAWIGALLLRDVLNAPVRIAGGRTLSGTKIVNQEKLHVVKSSDPAHAWIEVFDGSHWVPFDMTPKNNTPSGEPAPTDVEREDQKDKKPQPEEQSDDKDKKDADDQKKDEATDETKDEAGEQGEETTPTETSDKGDGKKASEEDGEETGSKRIDDLIKVNSTERKMREDRFGLLDHLLNRNELVFLEQLIREGPQQTAFQKDAALVVDALTLEPNWKNRVQRSKNKISTMLQDVKFVKFPGLPKFLSEIRIDLTQNNARVAKQKLMVVQRLLLAIAEYRNLTRQETDALQAIDGISQKLDQIKHENSKEFDAVHDLLKGLPGNISKAWLTKQYGKDFAQLGSPGSIKMAQDIVSGKLKPLLQMAAVKDFVDMTLDSTPEPRWKDEPTFNRSLAPKARQDLVVTRNPFDFAKMLWSLRPGEHMFAPTIQGRQFAIGSLETRRVPNPKNPIERKVSVVYYDVSPSMEENGAIENQDALLMAFVDKALSETDAIGRPTHEIYLIPFNDQILEGVHISSREDALNFISRSMNMRTATSGSTDIQKVIENFYEIVATSYKSKSTQGREKLFQKANMVLFTDGGSRIDMNQLEKKRKTIPSDVEINMNFVSIGDEVNETLKALSENGNLSSGKPLFRKMDRSMLKAISGISTAYDPDAFATDQKLSGQIISEINGLLERINVDTRLHGDSKEIDRALSQIRITSTDVSQVSGLRVALSL
ncbi:MAG TPA: hypothetical protein VM432_00080, partial [Bdellovibrionales bacterium]|nr:hypothetical protein [Bdellovibrionales bacterium]